MITREQKQNIVKELVDRFDRQKIAVFVKLHRISANELVSLRKELKSNNSEFKVARKTLLERALREVEIDLNARELEGEVGITFGYGDELQVAKVLTLFGKGKEEFKILGGVLGDKVISSDQINTMAKIQAKEVLLGKIAGALQSPIRNFAYVLSAPMRDLANALDQVAKSRK